MGWLYITITPATRDHYAPDSTLLHDPNIFAKNLSKVKERPTYTLSDQNDYARPEDSNARYHYTESEVRCLATWPQLTQNYFS